MPDALPPATPGQINKFLEEILPIIEKEYDETLALFATPVAESVSMRLMAQIDASLMQRAFFDRISSQDSYGNAWGRDFVTWCHYILRSFVAEPVGQRARGLIYALPKGLLPQFEVIDPAERELILATISRPHRLQVSQIDNHTDVLLFRQVD